MKTTSQNRKAVSTVGIAAIAVIFTVSLLALNFDGTQASAANMPANKFASSESSFEIAALGETVCQTYKGNTDQTCTEGVASQEIILNEFAFSTSDKNTWLIDGAFECATTTQIVGKGKDSTDLSGAVTGAQVSLFSKHEKESEWTDRGSWNLCQQDLQMQTNLNDLIVSCQEAFDAGLLTFPDNLSTCPAVQEEDGTWTLTDPNKLIYECALTGETGDVCEQSVELYLRQAGSYNAKWILKNLEHGIHDVKVVASVSAGPSEGGWDGVTVEGDIDHNLVYAGTFLGKRVVVGEPVLAYDTSS